jgi:hypothetical protein
MGFAESHLGAGIGTTKQDTRAGTSKRGSLAGVAKSTQSRDGTLGEPLLAEAGLGKSHQGSENSNLGVHDNGRKWS